MCNISLVIHCLFHASDHPIILSAEKHAPCPNEWCFDPGESIKVKAVPYIGLLDTVVGILLLNLEVKLGNNQGIHCFAYCDVVKVFSVGDYVECI